MRSIFCRQKRNARCLPWSGQTQLVQPIHLSLIWQFPFEHFGNFNGVKFADFWLCSVWFQVYRSWSRCKINKIFCRSYYSKVITLHIWGSLPHLNQIQSVLRGIVRQVIFFCPISIGLSDCDDWTFSGPRLLPSRFFLDLKWTAATSQSEFSKINDVVSLSSFILKIKIVGALSCAKTIRLVKRRVIAGKQEVIPRNTCVSLSVQFRMRHEALWRQSRVI